MSRFIPAFLVLFGAVLLLTGCGGPRKQVVVEPEPEAPAFDEAAAEAARRAALAQRPNVRIRHGFAMEGHLADIEMLAIIELLKANPEIATAPESMRVLDQQTVEVRTVHPGQAHGSLALVRKLESGWTVQSHRLF